MKNKIRGFGKDIISTLGGIGIVLRKWQYTLLFIVFFAVFGLLLSLLNTGTSEISLLFSGIEFVEKLDIISTAFMRIFVAPTILILSVLQATIFSLLIYIWRTPRLKMCRKDGTENAGIGAIMAFLGAGCPTCGISLVTPLFATLFSTGAYTAVAVFGVVALILAFVISILTLIYLGREVKRGNEN